MVDLRSAVEAITTDFSGVVRVDSREVSFSAAYGLADRRLKVPNTVDTRFAVASGTKGLTALVIGSLLDDALLALDSPARALLGDDLPLIDPAVTVEHLLAHTSGIGDYADEETNPPLAVPVQSLDTTEDYLPALDGHPTNFAPGERFSYNNGAYVVLALLAERATGRPFPELVRERVCEPAGMVHTGFPRSDELPENTATGYLDGVRTNVFSLPVRGSGDGGAYSTVADFHALWPAFLGGRIASKDTVAAFTEPRNDYPKGNLRYGLGFWLHAKRKTVVLSGYDAGVSFESAHDPTTGYTYTVVSNTAEGAWPVAKVIASYFDGLVAR